MRGRCVYHHVPFLGVVFGRGQPFQRHPRHHIQQRIHGVADDEAAHRADGYGRFDSQGDMLPLHNL